MVRFVADPAQPGSTYCYLHQDIFLPLSQKANMVYKEDKGIYYLPANYLKNPTPLRVTVATSARPFTLDIPLGPAEGPVREIDGEPCVVSYFQPQTLEADELGLAGNVFGSVRVDPTVSTGSVLMSHCLG